MRLLITICLAIWIAICSAAFVQLGSPTSSGSGGTTYSTVIRTTDATQNNNATPTNDDVLLFPITGNAGDRYIIDAYVEYQSSTTADILISFSVPTGTTGSGMVYKLASSGTTCSTTASMEPLLAITDNSRPGGVGTGVSCMASIKGYVVSGSTAGNVTFEWSQAVAEATDTVVKAGSYLNYRKAN